LYKENRQIDEKIVNENKITENCTLKKGQITKKLYFEKKDKLLKNVPKKDKWLKNVIMTNDKLLRNCKMKKRTNWWEIVQWKKVKLLRNCAISRSYENDRNRTLINKRNNAMKYNNLIRIKLNDFFPKRSIHKN